MPEYYTNNEGTELLVVGYEELVPAFYKNEKSLSAIVSRDMKRGFGMRKVSRGHNNGRAFIEFDSLPQIVQDKMYDPRRELHPIEKFYKHNVEAERFYTQYMFPDGRRITPDIKLKYTANASTIEAVIALKEAREIGFARCGKRPKKLWEGLCSEAKSFKVIQKKKFGYEHTLPESVKRFKEVVCSYFGQSDKKSAYSLLISAQHISNSIAGARKVDSKTLDLFESIFTRMGYKPNYTDVYETYTDFVTRRIEIISNTTGEVLNPDNFESVSESTIRAYLMRWESKAATLRLRTGDRQVLMGETKPYHSMIAPKYAGSLYSIDDRQPPFEYVKGERVWFYLGYDLGAECYTTIVWGKDKKGIILDFYRQMVRNYAQWGMPLPAELEAESNLNASFTDTFLREGNMFEYVRIEANNARGKRIENANRQMRYGDERKSEGWIARPFAKSESNRPSADKVKILPFETIVEQTLERYEKFNNTPHPRENNLTRWEFFMTRQNPNLKPINWQGIIPYLGMSAKSSCHTGIVRLNKGECLLGTGGKIALGEDLIKLMKLAEGEELDIKWLDGNDGKVLKAYAYIGEQYVCELLPKPEYARARIEQTASDAAARELMSSYTATVEGYGNKRKKEIEKITVLQTESTIANREPEYRFTIPALHKEKTVKRLETADVLDDDDDELNSLLMFVERPVKGHLMDRF